METETSFAGLVGTGGDGGGGGTEHGLNSTAHSGLRHTSGSAAYFRHVTSALWLVVPPALLLGGSVGNGMTVVVMRGMRGAQSSACLAVYFTALALSDQCLLLTAAVHFWVERVVGWPPSLFRHHLLCRVPSFLWYTSSFTSAWLLVAMTYQRVTSVVAPHRVAVLCTVRRGKIIVITIATAASLFNLPLLFLLTYDSEYGECVLITHLDHFVVVFTLLDLSVVSVIPFFFLIIGNSVLIWQVLASIQFSRSMREERGQQVTSGKKQVYPMTRTLLLTSTAFLILSLPTCVFDLYERTSPAAAVETSDGDSSARTELVKAVVFFLWLSTGATNFYLYLLSGRKFREEAKRYLCPSRVPPLH